MFTNKWLICNFKLICDDEDVDFSSIEDGETRMGMGIGIGMGSGDRVNFHSIPVLAQGLISVPIPIGDENFSPMQGRALMGSGIPHSSAIPTFISQLWEQQSLKNIIKVSFIISIFLLVG